MDTKIASRRICSDPDNVCFQGGCLYCNLEPFRLLTSVRRMSIQLGMLEDFDDGLRNDFFNTEVR